MLPLRGVALFLFLRRLPIGNQVDRIVIGSEMQMLHKRQEGNVVFCANKSGFYAYNN